jgi:hypothetical protein
MSHHAAFLLLGALHEEARELPVRERDDPEYVALVAATMLAECDALALWFEEAGGYDMAAEFDELRAAFRALA